MNPKIEKTDAQWQAILRSKNAEALALEVTRHEATERPFSGRYADFDAPGLYRCICCGQPLFASATKFDAGCGWPSYFAPVEPEALSQRSDNRLWLQRTEVRCADCDAHLGHVFDDGPAPTGLRYCINSAALQFEGQAEPDKPR